MASLPLDVSEVLEQEYEAQYHAAPAPLPTGVLYDEAQIVDGPYARSILATCQLNDAEETVETLLNRLVQSGNGIEKLKDSPVLTSSGVAMMRNYESYVIGKGDAVKERVRRRIVDTAFDGAVKSLRDLRLANLYGELHTKPAADARAALCISGGGIRSATFALGVIQGLAGARILDKFHYLSTVSGGGYIGSWLSSWGRRHPEGMTGVQDDLVRGDSAVGGARIDGKPEEKAKLPDAKLNPEPQPVRHLREYSNYLSPRLGLTSGDSWTIASLYIRNLLLNLLVLVPILAAVIAFPRLFAWLLNGAGYFEGHKWIDPSMLLNIAVGFTAIGFAYMGFARPVEHGRKDAKSAAFGWNANRRFVLGCVVPLLIASTFLALFWAREHTHDGLLRHSWFWRDAIVGWVAMIVAPFVPYYVRMKRASATDRRDPVGRDRTFTKKFALELFAAIVGIASNAALLLLIAVKVFSDPLAKLVDPNPTLPILRPILENGQLSSVFVCLAVPAVLLIFFVQASVFVGLSSRLNEDYDREWWGRAGAWLLMFAAFLALASIVSVFGPVLLYHAPVIVASLGGVSGIAAALIGHSSKTSATKSEAEKPSIVGKIGSALLVPVFCLVFLAGISLATTWLFQQFTKPATPLTTAFESQFRSSAEEKVSVKVGTHTFVQTTVVPPAPVFSAADAQALAHLAGVQQTSWWQLAFLAGVALVGWALSHAIGVNRFSMHAFYRNRLVRAYLGASRYGRDPDQFTGFDANDNLQMYELRRELLWPSQFTNAAAFVDALAKKKDSDEAAKQLWQRIDRVTQSRIAAGQRDSAVTDAVTQHINAILSDRSLTFAGRKSPAAKRDALSAIAPLPPPRRGPMHVVNTTLNLTVGENFAWQQRMAESFTVSPMHCGSAFLGYRDAREYGGDDGISLGNAVTISGAAASPNMGYSSSVPLAFLLTLFNVRLGSWLGNPGVVGENAYRAAHPDSNLEPLLGELTGSSSDAYPWIYLSDGGHFENLALYEMVLRRCRYIVVSDGGCDPTFSFDDLGNAIRKIRIDLGVPIEIRKIEMLPRAEPGKPMATGSYMAIGSIRYGAIDKGAPDGTLIYIKPSVYDGDFLPRDVYNYAQESPAFPHEPTSDQFFSESQFESYRALGRHVVNVICDNYVADEPATYANTYGTVADFFEAVAPQPGVGPRLPIRRKADVTPPMPGIVLPTSDPAATDAKGTPRA